MCFIFGRIKPGWVSSAQTDSNKEGQKFGNLILYQIYQNEEDPQMTSLGRVSKITS